jgi:hypothetical protein
MTNEDKVRWMRDLGIVEASWSADGDVLALKLGPVPPAPASSEEDDDPVKRRSAEERERYARDERRRIALAASGGLVRRVSAED